MGWAIAHTAHEMQVQSVKKKLQYEQGGSNHEKDAQEDYGALGSFSVHLLVWSERFCGVNYGGL